MVERVAEALRSRSRAVPGSRVHLFGMAYKANVGDVRESPAIAVAELLQRGGAVVGYSDPLRAGRVRGFADAAGLCERKARPT